MTPDYISDYVDLSVFSLGGSGKFMTEDDALKLSDTLSIANAACCIVGVSPALITNDTYMTIHLNAGDSNINDLLPSAETNIVVQAICNAITTGKLEVAHLERPDSEHATAADYVIKETIIEVDELKRWLLSRNCKPQFFFGADAGNTPDYLELKHPNFSAEIAAAIRAWEAIQDPELRKGKTAKAAATEWLETNYRELGLMHNGKRSGSAIERIATIVNWETSGGAPKTPG
ncbi:hypothetical protein [Marinobacter salexigens]|uniref:hypothetical protein n=1 Tax=Marinobacter salexigens TaxID=1925763 RepID=UPI000C28711A|nr:hypothetical protein [Marinobacter salexigens]